VLNRSFFILFYFFFCFHLRNRHPFVAPVELFFYEGDSAYAELPFYVHSTLRDWLGMQGGSAAAARAAWSQVLRGVAWLHANCLTLGGNLTADTVVFAGDGTSLTSCRAAIAATPLFRQCATLEPGAMMQQMSPWGSGAGRGGTIGSKSFEIPDLADVAEDVAALGACLLESLSADKFIEAGGHAADLIRTVKLMVHRDVHMRPSAATLLSHPFFADTLSLSAMPFVNAGNAGAGIGMGEDDDEDSGSPQRCYRDLWRTRSEKARGPLVMDLSWDDFHVTLLYLFEACSREEFLQDLVFCVEAGRASIPGSTRSSFASTSGSSLGGGAATAAATSPPGLLLPSALVFDRFWRRVMDEMRFFSFSVDAHGNVVAVPTREAPAHELAMLGRIALKCILDSCRIPTVLAVLFYRVLVWMDTSVLGHGKLFIRQGKLLDPAPFAEHRAQLRALGEGLVAYNLSRPLREGLTLLEFCWRSDGADVPDTGEMARRLVFRFFPADSATPQMVREWVHSLDERGARAFLLYAAGVTSLSGYMPVEKDPAGASAASPLMSAASGAIPRSRRESAATVGAQPRAALEEQKVSVTLLRRSVGPPDCRRVRAGVLELGDFASKAALAAELQRRVQEYLN
jgi:hypothetical protein